MTEFTMSMYRNKEDLYKAKAEYYEQEAAFWKEAFEKLCYEAAVPETPLSKKKVTWVMSEEIPNDSLSYLTPKKWYRYYWEDHTIAVDTGDIIGLPSYLSGGYSWRAKAVDEGVDPNDGVSVNPNGDES